MRIGITYDLKSDQDVGDSAGPDDLLEEFDSPVTIEAIVQALTAAGHEVEKLGDGRELLKRLLADPPDFVFNLAEGHGHARSREARVPAVLEMLGIPFSGSDPLALAASLDKEVAKRLVAGSGVHVPDHVLITGPEQRLPSRFFDQEAFPVLLKPAWEGSSKGIRQCCLVEEPKRLAAAVAKMLEDYQQPVLVEEFVEGDELTVGMVGNAPPRILGSMRILPRSPTTRFIYSLEVKRDFERQVFYEYPPGLPAEVMENTEKAALAAFMALGCRDVARADFRVRCGVPYFLEINPLPGLNPQTSDLVILARLAGQSHQALVQQILQAALKRQAGAFRSPCLSVT
jgi:D-alanine-D-alanine ligase